MDSNINRFRRIHKQNTKLINAKDIKTIRVYGFKAFAECLRAYAEVEYDYVNTLRKQTDAKQINQTYLDPNRGGSSAVRTHKHKK